jgi:outer membrane autotransporter protein
MKPLKKQAGVLAMALGAMTINVSEAAIDLKPGASMLITDSDPVYEFNLVGAALTVKNGGETGRIVANSNASLTMDSGRVTSIGEPAIALYNSSAVINNSTIIAAADPARPDVSSFGIRLSGFEQASSALISNSFVSGTGRGINVTDSATLQLFNTQVEGHAGAPGNGFVSGGAGVVIAGASASFNQGSLVTGDNNGVVIWSDSTGSVEKTASLVVDQSSVVGLDGSAILISKTAASDKDVSLKIQNGSTLFGGNGIALEVNNGAVGHVEVNNSRLVGDVLVESGSTANLDLQNNASITGTLTNVTALKIDGSSLWTMEQNSTVGALNLDGGTVNLRGTDGNASFHQLDVNELSGNGTFVFGTNIGANLGDTLNVNGAATGNHRLVVENTGTEPLEGGPDLALIHTNSGDATFAVNSKDGLVDAGTFAYELQQRPGAADSNDWVLSQTGSLSKSTEATIGMFSAAPTIWYGETTTLRSRMGELRTDKDQGGGWMRTYGNKYNMSAGGGVDYSQVQQGISFGADMPVSNSNGQWLLGVMGGYSKSDLDLREGSNGTVHSTYIGAYSTWLSDSGFYVDALIKANHFKNQTDVVMRDGVKTKGKYSNYGVGGSIEAGKHIKLADEWFVEPYAQLSTLFVSGQSYDLDNGLEASSNKANSILGKVGTHVGRKFALDDGGFVQPYVKVAVAQEFAKNNKMTINDNRFTNDLSGTRGEFGVGVAAQLTDVLQVHTDFDYMKGSNIEQPWGVNVGLRYNW